MAADRPDFNQIKKLIGRLKTLESDFAGIFAEAPAQREALQGICRQTPAPGSGPRHLSRLDFIISWISTVHRTMPCRLSTASEKNRLTPFA